MRKSTRFCLALLSGLLAGTAATVALWLNDVDRRSILAWIDEALFNSPWLRSHPLCRDACNAVLLLWPLIPLAAIAALVCAVSLRLVPLLNDDQTIQDSNNLRRGALWGKASLSLQIILAFSAFCRFSLELGSVVLLLAEGRAGALLYRPAESGFHFHFLGGSLRWWPSLTFNPSTWGPMLPLWIPAAFCLAMAVCHFERDRRRHGAGVCRQCGYDLAGNVSGTCPECGKPLR